MRSVFLKRFNHQSGEVPEQPSTTSRRKSQANCSAEKCQSVLGATYEGDSNLISVHQNQRQLPLEIGKVLFSYFSEKQIHCLVFHSGRNQI